MIHTVLAVTATASVEGLVFLLRHSVLAVLTLALGLLARQEAAAARRESTKFGTERL